MAAKKFKLSKPVRTRLLIDSLRPHPAQLQFFDPPSPAALRLLADDMQKTGQREAIQVLPEKNAAGLRGLTVLDGMSRIEAIRLNGGSEIDAIVRYDLATKTVIELMEIFLGFNTNRRQLHLLDRAACLLNMLQANAGEPDGFSVGSCDQHNARDKIGKLIGVSGRHLQRLFKILLLPRAIQRAVRDGRLQMVVAEKLEKLDKGVQAEIAETLEGITDATVDLNAIVRGYIPATQRSTNNGAGERTFVSFIKVINARIDMLESSTGKIFYKTILENADTLRRLKAFIKRVMSDAKKVDPAAADAAFKKIADAINQIDP